MLMNKISHYSSAITDSGIYDIYALLHLLDAIAIKAHFTDEKVIGILTNKREIYIKESLNKEQKRMVIAHLIGHLLCEPNQNYVDTVETVFFPESETEKEADKIAKQILFGIIP
jgi:Zn-dependent peptidase ImmA (M78 family)